MYSGIHVNTKGVASSKCESVICSFVLFNEWSFVYRLGSQWSSQVPGNQNSLTLSRGALLSLTMILVRLCALSFRSAPGKRKCDSIAIVVSLPGMAQIKILKAFRFKKFLKQCCKNTFGCVGSTIRGWKPSNLDRTLFLECKENFSKGFTGHLLES